MRLFGNHKLGAFQIIFLMSSSHKLLSFVLLIDETKLDEKISYEIKHISFTSFAQSQLLTCRLYAYYYSFESTIKRVAARFPMVRNFGKLELRCAAPGIYVPPMAEDSIA